MTTYKEWLQSILDNGSIIINGEPYPAHEIYKVDMLDSETHIELFDCWKHNVSAELFEVKPLGETWGIA